MKIVKVVSVVDTREYQEQGDTFVPIPGSGRTNACGRCAREHEIHWTVLLEGGEQAVLGGSCAKAGSLDQKFIQSTERAVVREKKLERQLATYESRLAELGRVMAEVEALPRPPIVHGEHVCKDGSKIPTISIGDSGAVWCQFEGVTEERKRFASTSWGANRIAERTKVKESVYVLRNLIKSTKKSLDAARSKLSTSLQEIT